MANLRMCPHCRAFVDSSERICTECHEPLGRTYAQRVTAGAALAGLVPPTHFTTIIILLINGALFAATVLLSMQRSGGGLWAVNSEVLYYFGAKESLSILTQGQWWRLVTAGFLHGGLLHILMNSWALYDLGAQTEEAYGTARFLVFYLASSVAGFAASTFWSRALSIGASAALFGLIGAMIAFAQRHRSTLLGMAMKSVYTRWAVYGLLFSLIPGIDIAAHVGGLISGFVLGYVAGVPGPNRAIEWCWKAAAVVAVLIVGASFLLAWASFQPPT
ncbi:MAG TPA: rhomboid family intramembrane serine protease [Bryobacterales bacterium]|jgi:rhomboid protease GluP|nr:rhomboid family intramembrane serine protease [Bryobacterales bacterium]